MNARPLALPEGLSKRRQIGELELSAAFVLSSGDPRFGGLSGLLVESDQLLALSDRAYLWQARLRLDPAGTLQALESWRVDAIGDPAADDTEALARLPGGSLFAATETPARILPLAGNDQGYGDRLADAFGDAPPNQGVEALASLPGGGLLALGEAKGDDGGHRAVALGNNGDQMLRYVAADGFRPTAADRWGQQIIVLERRFSLFGGLEGRLVALDAAQLSTKEGTLVGEELARLDASTIGENFEGVAVSRRADGAYVIYVASDDNFSPLQRTLLI